MMSGNFRSRCCRRVCAYTRAMRVFSAVSRRCLSLCLSDRSNLLPCYYTNNKNRYRIRKYPRLAYVYVHTYVEYYILYIYYYYTNVIFSSPWSDEHAARSSEGVTLYYYCICTCCVSLCGLFLSPSPPLAIRFP